jgi:hypothetical protein
VQDAACFVWPEKGQICFDREQGLHITYHIEADALEINQKRNTTDLFLLGRVLWPSRGPATYSCEENTTNKAGEEEEYVRFEKYRTKYGISIVAQR